MNLADILLANEREHTFELIHPVSGEATGILVTVLSEHSSKVRDRLMRSLPHRQSAAATLAGFGNPAVGRINQLLEDAIRATWARVVGWKGLTRDGVEIPFSEASAHETFQAAPWIMTSIMDASNDLSNFRARPESAAA